MDWNVQNGLIGKRVIVFTADDDDGQEATVIGISDTEETIMAKTDDGDILVGIEWCMHNEK